MKQFPWSPGRIVHLKRQETRQESVTKKKKRGWIGRRDKSESFRIQTRKRRRISEKRQVKNYMKFLSFWFLFPSWKKMKKMQQKLLELQLKRRITQNTFVYDLLTRRGFQFAAELSELQERRFQIWMMNKKEKRRWKSTKNKKMGGEAKSRKQERRLLMQKENRL